MKRLILNSIFFLLLQIYCLEIQAIDIKINSHNEWTSPKMPFTNLLCDPGFDNSTNYGSPPNSGCWNLGQTGSSGDVLDGVPGQVRSLPNSLHIYTGVESGYYFSRPWQDDIPAQPGQKYKGGAWIKKPAAYAWQAGYKAFVTISFHDVDHCEIARHFSSPFVSGSSIWTNLELSTPAAPSGTAFVRFSIFLEKPLGLTGQAIINADDCYLEEITIPDIELYPQILSFGGSLDSLRFKLSNTGIESISWEANSSLLPAWLHISPSSGVIQAGSQVIISSWINTEGNDSASELSTVLTIETSLNQSFSIPVSAYVPPTPPSGPSISYIENNILFLQKRVADNCLSEPVPFPLKGFVWSAAQSGTDATLKSRRAAFFNDHREDLAWMRGANVSMAHVVLDFGVNPDTFLTILDNCYRNEIMLLVTIDEANNNIANAIEVVNAYKNHPAILGWVLGNEWTINRYYNHFQTLLAAAQATEMAAQTIQSLDPNHPVISSIGDIAIMNQSPSISAIINTLCPSIDFWCINVYRGQSFGDLFSHWSSLTNKPFYISEFGIDSYHTMNTDCSGFGGYQSEWVQAEWDSILWLEIVAHLSTQTPNGNCLGGALFEWTDEWWKITPSGHHNNTGYYTWWNTSAFPDSYGNEENFGMKHQSLDGVMYFKRVYYTFRDLFSDTSDPEFLYPTITIQVENETAPGNMDGSAQAIIVDAEQPYTYFWSTGATSESLSQVTAGNYSLTIVDGNGCLLIKNFNIGLSTIVKESTDIGIVKVYPNPASNKLYLELPTQSAFPVEADILDMNGKIIYSQTSLDKIIVLDISIIPHGIYILSVSSNKGTAFIKFSLL